VQQSIAATIPVRIRLNEVDTIFEQVNGEIRALQLITGACCTISGTGVVVFLLLSSEPSTRELVEALAQKYEASAATIEKDLEIFLDQLREGSWVIAAQGAEHGANRPTRWHSGRRLPYSPPAIQVFHDPSYDRVWLRRKLRALLKRHTSGKVRGFVRFLARARDIRFAWIMLFFGFRRATEQRRTALR
jgi:hypothetical protein